MGGSDSRRAPRRRVDAAAKQAFANGLRAGLKRDDAARAAGFTANAFYYAGTRDPLFASACRWAMDLSAADERSARAAAAPLEGRNFAPVPNANRRLQARPVRRPRFDDRRRRIFLDHFAGTADLRQAARAAGVAPCTVNQHRRADAAFAAACEEALGHAYATLEAEAVRQRLEAQRNLREGLCPTGEVAQEFDRVLKLLARYERKNGRVGTRTLAPGRERRWTFDDAIEALDKKLSALGIRRNLLPPPQSDQE